MVAHRFRAPGRVNLIGDHTDYNDGLVLPLAIDRHCVVTVSARSDRRLVAGSRELTGRLDVPLDTELPVEDPGWGGFVVAATRAVAARGGRISGAAIEVDSDVPVGAGLSSSAALSTALVLALADLGAVELTGIALARAAHETERLATGVETGLMDQLAAAFGRRDHALLIDCRTNECTPIPLPKDAAIVVIHSGRPRALAGSEYSARRDECHTISTHLGLSALRDASPEDVADEPRARHVVSENERVLATASALRAGDLATVGALMLASHASLRDDFEVSTPELDALVVAFMEAGAFGARLTGAGFGGCVIGLVAADKVPTVAREVERRSRSAAGSPSAPFLVHAADGAGPCA